MITSNSPADPFYRRAKFSFALVLAGSAFALAGCDDGYLRAAVEPSSDGRTYFALIDDNGGFSCLLDGVAWPHAIGVPAPIEPGSHTIKCGVMEETFAIPPGVVYGHDYWGP